MLKSIACTVCEPPGHLPLVLTSCVLSERLCSMCVHGPVLMLLLFSFPGIWFKCSSPRQLWSWNNQTVYATKDNAGEPQGPHILFRK